MERGVLLRVAVACVLFIGSGCTEPQVIIFEGTDARLEDVYDASRQMYFVPAVKLDPKTQELHKEGFRGKGVIAAIIDTGVLSHHPVIKKALIKSVDFTGEGPEDLKGHGTVVALIHLAGAPESEILSVKAVDKNGKGRIENLIKAIQWAVKEGSKVINLSLGVYLPCKNMREYGERSVAEPESCEQHELCKTISLASEVVVVAAVGNVPGQTACPACCRDAIAVGATTLEGKIAPYSGAYPDVVAPGTVFMVPYKP